MKFQFKIILIFESLKFYKTLEFNYNLEYLLKSRFFVRAITQT